MTPDEKAAIAAARDVLDVAIRLAQDVEEKTVEAEAREWRLVALWAVELANLLDPTKQLTIGWTEQ